jgi:hypothetical protein
MATEKTYQNLDPFAVREDLREALDGSGIVLPSLRVDPQMPELIELGRVRVDVAARLAEAVRRGGRE